MGSCVPLFYRPSAWLHDDRWPVPDAMNTRNDAETASDVRRLADYVRALGARPHEVDNGCLTFTLEGSEGAVRLKDCGTRLVGSVLIGEPGDDFEKWVSAQQPPSSAAFGWLLDDEAENDLRVLVFERPLDEELGQDDPLSRELKAYKEGWARRRKVRPPSVPPLRGDPRDLEPQQAWLVIGDEASWPTEDELNQQAELGAVGIFNSSWTAAKQTQPGDLLLFYFMGPRKAVHFVARAASPAFYDAERGVNSIGTPSDHQWWVFHTPLVPVEPITFKLLQVATGGHLILKGRSGKFLHPETVQALSITHTEAVTMEEVEEVVRIPTGRADLPDPNDTDLATLSSLAAGALRLESDVSTHIVGPLLRHARTGTDLVVVPEFRIGAKRADFMVLDGDRPVCVVEVKLAIVGRRGRPSPDELQTLGYAAEVGCASVLIDANKILLFDSGSSTARRTIMRSSLTEATAPEFLELRDHILRGATGTRRSL